MQQDVIEQSKSKTTKLPTKASYPPVDRAAAIAQSEWQWVVIVGSILTFIISLPYIWGFAFAQPEGGLFTGVLVNPIDGASYFAKMMMGSQGGWLYTLPYTPEPHQGVFLFTFYLGLGHLSRLLSISPALVFNLVRIMAGMIMFLAIYRFIADWTEDTSQRRMTWAITVLSGGLGWLLLPTGVIGLDILILPEAFPLQAVYANPHFPLAIAAGAFVAHVFYTVFFITPDVRPGTNYETLGLVVAVLFLVSASPFVLLPLGLACGAVCIRLWIITGRFPFIPVEWGLIVVAVGLPLAAYNVWAVSDANPVIAAWMKQNQTPSPAVWHYLAAFGPVLLLAAIGLQGTLRRRILLEDWMLIVWIVATVVLLYAPIGLQRRFTLGLMLPLAIYAGRGLRRVVLQSVKRKYRPRVLAGVFAVMLPSTILAILLPVLGSSQPVSRDYFFLSGSQLETYDWLKSEAPAESLILASQTTSLYIPVYAPESNVVYAHEFETLRAEQREQSVKSFFDGTDCSVVEAEAVDFVVVGPAEQRITGENDACPINGDIAFESVAGDMVIYQVVR